MGSTAAFNGPGEPEQDWLQLIDELIGQTEQTDDPPARAALLCKAAEIYERRLNDSNNAMVALQAAFRVAYDVKLRTDAIGNRLTSRLRRLTGSRPAASPQPEPRPAPEHAAAGK